MPAGSVLSASTLWVATVRLPPACALSVTRPPKRFTQTAAVSSIAISAVADLRKSAAANSTGTARPSQGRKVSVRLPRLPMSLGSSAWKIMTSEISTASAASTIPRRQMPGSLRSSASRRRRPSREGSGSEPSLPVSVMYACAMPLPSLPCSRSVPAS